MSKWSFVILSLCAVGCADDAPDRGASNLEQNPDTTTCARKDRDACAADPSCRPIYGTAWNEQAACTSDADEAVGCVDADASCPASIRYASSRDGRAFQLVSGCVPSGFTEFQPAHPSGKQCNDQGCASLSIDACKASASCKVASAQRLDLARQCTSERSEVGCVDKEKTCGESVTAKDSSGATWLFENTCVPRNFTGWTHDGDYYALWYACNDSRPPCPELDVATCKTDDRCWVLSGRKWDVALECAGEQEEIGCMKKRPSCPALLHAMTSPAGQPYLLATGCTPEGWPEQTAAPIPLSTRLGALCSDDQACEAKNLADCANDERCTVMGGRPLDETSCTYGAEQPLICRAKPVGCTTAITYAKDPQGKVWQFNGGGHGCVPNDFSALSSAPACP
jgi:hypothetical protein